MVNCDSKFVFCDSCFAFCDIKLIVRDRLWCFIGGKLVFVRYLMFWGKGTPPRLRRVNYSPPPEITNEEGKQVRDRLFKQRGGRIVGRTKG